MKKMAQPLCFDAIHGRVKEADVKDEIKASIKAILMTTLHERLLRPTFGSRLQDYVFSSINYTTLEMMKKEILVALRSQEHRIHNLQVTFQNPREQDASLYVFVSYEVMNEQHADCLTLEMNQEGIHI